MLLGQIFGSLNIIEITIEQEKLQTYSISLLCFFQFVLCMHVNSFISLPMKLIVSHSTSIIKGAQVFYKLTCSLDLINLSTKLCNLPFLNKRCKRIILEAYKVATYVKLLCEKIHMHAHRESIRSNSYATSSAPYNLVCQAIHSASKQKRKKV